MKFSHLGPVLVVLHSAFGPTPSGETTSFEEDCAGSGALTSGVKVWGLKAKRRDAAWKHHL